MSIVDEIAEIDPDAIFWGESETERGYLDEAVIGWASRCGSPAIVVYDRQKLVEAFVRMWSEDQDTSQVLTDDDREEGLTVEDVLYQQADEWVSFNLEGAYVGPATPFILNTIEDE